MKKTSYKKLNDLQKKLVDAAKRALSNSYSPYSKFSVGAAVLTVNNKIINGSNVENASYGATICAERAAIINANNLFNKMIRSIAIIGDSGNPGDKHIIAPCGICRQSIFEASQISGIDIEIIMCSCNQDKVLISKISELFPLGFGPKDINVKIK